MLKRQDPTFRAQENEETGQTLISGMGELHLEVIQHRLERDFNLKVKVHRPRVSYRETIERAVEVTGECHRIIAGQQLFAKLRLRVEPWDKGTQPVTVYNNVPFDSLRMELVDAAMDELKARGEGGGFIGGFPLMKMKVTLLSGESHELQSNEIAFRIAASDAFDKALRDAGPTLLEPIMKLDIRTPEDYLGNIVGDLQMRRAIIVNTGHAGRMSTIEAHAPLAELFGYSSAIRSLSQGLAGQSMEPLEYAPAPASVAESFAL
jgi:elongation factor G